MHSVLHDADHPHSGQVGAQLVLVVGPRSAQDEAVHGILL